MSIADRKERERQEMRQGILQAAAHLFVTEGFPKTTIRAIASEIEYSPGTIYTYFKDKQEILNALFHQFFDELNIALRTAGEAVESTNRLTAIGRAYIDFALQNPEHYELMFLMNHERLEKNLPDVSPEVDCFDAETGKKVESAQDDGSFQYMQEAIQLAIQSGRQPRYDLHTSTLLAWSLVHGIVALHIRGFLQMYPPDYLQIMIHHAVDGISSSIFLD
jgi:AcrR family transcriptional regulator